MMDLSKYNRTVFMMNYLEFQELFKEATGFDYETISAQAEYTDQVARAYNLFDEDEFWPGGWNDDVVENAVAYLETGEGEFPPPGLIIGLMIERGLLPKGDYLIDLDW